MGQKSVKSEGRRPPSMTFPMCFVYFAVEGGADQDAFLLEASGSNHLSY
jgi:hypothetical protein